MTYNVIRAITDNKKGISFIIAVFFLLHPVQSEAVACIAGISNLAFTFLCLSSFYIYITAVSPDGRNRKAVMYAFSLFIFSLALLTKEQSVVLPVLIVAYELCFGSSDKKLLKRFQYPTGYFALLAGYFVLRKIFASAPTHFFAEKHELWLTLLSIPRGILNYLAIIIYPHDLHYYRSQDILLPFMGPIILLGVVMFVFMILINYASKPYKQWMMFGLSWFIISMLPTLNIIPLVNEYSFILTAEHFLYFPMIGFLLFVMGCSDFWFKHKPHTEKFFTYFLICSALSLFYFSTTIKQNEYWRGEIPLFERTLKFEENFGRVHFLLAQAYARAGRMNEAVEHDRKALAIMEGYAEKVKNSDIRKFYLIFIKQIHFHLGYSLGKLNHVTESLNHYEEALKLDPENEAFHFLVANIYIQNRDIPNAIAHLKKILDLNKNNLIAMNTLALCYKEIEDYEKAEVLLRNIVEMDSDSLSAKKNLNNFLKWKSTLKEKLGE